MVGQGPPISFRSVALEPELAARAPKGRGLGQVAKRDLARYYNLLRLLRQDLTLSIGEALVICAAMREVIHDVDLPQAETWTTAYALVFRTTDGADFRHFGLTPAHQQRWGTNGAALRSKVAGWSFEQRCAVLDGVERFWLRCASVDDPQAAQVLAEVGLVQAEGSAVEEPTRARER
jgi:hypothetical protein